MLDVRPFQPEAVVRRALVALARCPTPRYPGAPEFRNPKFAPDLTARPHGSWCSALTVPAVSAQFRNCSAWFWLAHSGPIGPSPQTKSVRGTQSGTRLTVSPVATGLSGNHGQT